MRPGAQFNRYPLDVLSSFYFKELSIKGDILEVD